ncbi:hypothetical protein AQ490_03525 [Wenjunlia vitaminophila]|uniref:Uncharacterized protein n=2 Tax=Wenjunlia vitaminophila TaxID=76728 RepID=A0A0T6LTH7_WENVI|nr:hypothetical protein AQ490_03525 [Wenjunlia vitaminophila]
MPPVRLLPTDALARLARKSPMFDAAVRLAHWIGPHRPVTADGVLELGDARRAARELNLLPPEDLESELDQIGGAEELPELDLPWSIAEELEFIDIEDGTARPGAALAAVDTAGAEELLDLWWEAAEVVVADACLPSVDALLASLEDGDLAAGEQELGLETDPELLYEALENLYVISALETGFDQERDADDEQAVPLPVLAASMVVPDDMEAPTDEALEEVSSLMMRLDGALQLVAGTGVVEYQPVDPALVVDDEEDLAASEALVEELDEEDVSRYGMVRLTPLGIYGVRRRLLLAGALAPAVGELVDAGADELLEAMADYPDGAARAEAQGWIEHRDPVAAARELLGAARGDDPQAPLRRLYCQQALALLGPAGDPALREVLDDRHLGGLARVRLAENRAADVPEPSEEMVFWLTVDTLAAQLAEDDEELLQELVRGIPVRDEHDSFFSAAWKVDHPATVEVLEALGRLHPDRAVAKEARKAALKARSSRA